MKIDHFKVFIILILFSAFLVTYVYGQETGYFEFPEGWQEKENPTERKQMLQVPVDKLHLIPTEHLLEICMEYPYLIDIYFFSDFQEGFEKLVYEFNGLQELLNRTDAKKVILNKYISLVANPGFFKDYSLSQKGGYSLKLFFVEILLSQKQFLAQFNNSDVKIVLTKSYSMLQEKHENRQVYGDLTKTSCYLLMARLIHREAFIANGQENMEKPIRDFIEKPIFVNDNVKYAVIEDTMSYFRTINH